MSVVQTATMLALRTLLYLSSLWVLERSLQTPSVGYHINVGLLVKSNYTWIAEVGEHSGHDIMEFVCVDGAI